MQQFQPGRKIPARPVDIGQTDNDTKDTRYLSPNQQDLLLAALNSQAGSKQSQQQPAESTTRTSMEKTDEKPDMNGSAMFQSPQEDLDNFNVEYTPDLDYLDGEGYDFDNADLGGEMIGSLPGRDANEKRKSREDSAAPEGGDAKRQETEDGEKAPKKPGRKPLTSEPTTVSTSHCSQLTNEVLI